MPKIDIEKIIAEVERQMGIVQKEIEAYEKLEKEIRADIIREEKNKKYKIQTAVDNRIEKELSKGVVKEPHFEDAGKKPSLETIENVRLFKSQGFSTHNIAKCVGISDEEALQILKSSAENTIPKNEMSSLLDKYDATIMEVKLLIAEEKDILKSADHMSRTSSLIAIQELIKSKVTP